MSIPFLRYRNRFRKPRSLRKHLIVGLLITTVVPILLIGAVSYYMIYLILDNKTVKGIESTLYQVRTTLEKTYNNLNYVSQQYAARDTQLLLESDEPVEKYILGQQVFARLQLLSFTNPDTNVVYIYTPGSHDVFYENQPIRPDSTPERLPVLTTYKGVTLYAPHATFGYGSGFVFSMSRSVNLIKGTGRSLYVETSTDVYDQLMNDRQFGIKTVQVLTDSSGFVVFSQDEAFPPGSRLPVDRDNKAYQIAGDHYYFQEYSQEQGWYVYSIIHKTDFRQEVQSWTIAWAAIAALSLLVSAAVGWWIWNMFYFPLRKLNKEIRYLGDSRYEDENQMQRDIRLTQIAEFDVLLTQFQDMRSNIWSLLTELKRQEEDKRHLEVEKLVAQINPHFLYNTLNTVQWLAKTKGEEEIVSLVTVFIRLLRYNLGKDGGRVKLRQEIDALNDYVALQQIRYNYEFTVDIQADPRSLDVPVPRFLLQPLIENALYHGLTEEDSAIELTITIDQERYLLVQVKDNGRGMSQEELQRLMQHKVPERDQVGMGIGLSYVNAMLLAHFGQASQLQASSSREEGTTMYFRIPVDDKQGGGDESSIDR